MRALVDEVMTTKVARVRPQTPLTQVGQLLRERGVTALPVVDEEEHVLGVVSVTDLGFEHERPRGVAAALRDRLARRGGRKAARTTAADRMSSPVVTVTPGVSLRTAARLLQVHGIHHLPVVADGKLVGMVTRRDLLAAFMRGDEQVRRQIVQAAEMTFHLTRAQVAVTVHSGVVRLEGRVEFRSLAEELERLAEAVDGVTAVESQLQWDVDDSDRATPIPSG